MKTWILTAGLILFILWDLLALGLRLALGRGKTPPSEQLLCDETRALGDFLPVEASTLVTRN